MLVLKVSLTFSCSLGEWGADVIAIGALLHLNFAAQADMGKHPPVLRSAEQARPPLAALSGIVR